MKHNPDTLPGALRVPGVLAVVLLLLAGCGEDPAADVPDPDEVTTHIEVVGTDELRFEPDRFVVPAGEEVTVELTSEPGAAHNFGGGELGFAIPGPRGEVVPPGQTASGTFTATEPGSYTVFCVFDDHHLDGMVAEIVVVDVGPP